MINDKELEPKDRLLRVFEALRFKGTVKNKTDEMWLRVKKSRNDQKPLQGTTIHNRMKYLKEIIGRAIKQELIKPKQIAGYNFPVYTQPETHYLTLAQTKEIADKIYNGAYDSNKTLRLVACGIEDI